MTMSEGFFQFLSPAEIYEKLTGGPGTSDLVFAQAQASDEWSREEGRADLIKSLADTINSGWQGRAGTHAYDAVMPLRDRTLQNATHLEHSQDLLSRQIGSFERAYNSVRPVMELPEQMLDEPVPFDGDHAKAVALYQAVAQHNIAVFQDYDGASSYNETNMPQTFHAGGRDGGDVSVRAADTIEVGEPRSSGEGSPPGGGGPGVVAGPWGPRGGEGPGVSSGYPGVSGGPPLPGGSVGPAGADGGPGVSASGIGQAAGGDHLPGSGQGSSVGGTGTGGSGGFAGQVPVGGNVGGVARGPVSGDSGGRSGGGNPGGPSSGGNSGARGGLPVRGPGGTVGVGALAAEESAVRRGVAAAGAGRGGLGAVGGPVGGGRGQDDEDSLHERKVLIEVDSEETFGSDVLTAPSVIGDEEFED